MVDIESYITELDKDLQVTAFNIKEVQMRLPAIKHKWVGRFIRHKIDLFKKLAARDAKAKEMRNAIMDQSPVKITEPAADRVAINSQTIKDMDAEIDNLKLVLEFLEKSEKTLSSMTWDIKNMVDLIKAEQS